MLSRYGSGLSYLLEMDLVDGTFLIKKAIEQVQQDKAYKLWVSIYPHMENPITFEQFYKPKPIETKKPMTAREIIERSERIRKAHQGEEAM